MRHVNFQDSFYIFLSFPDGIPSGDWRCRLASDGGGYYEASHLSGVYTNATEMDARTIRLNVDNHSLRIGRLHCQMVEGVEFNSTDGTALVHEFPHLDVCLWAGATDVQDITAEVVSAYITPTIGENGHWYINGQDTGKTAKGQTLFATFHVDPETMHLEASYPEGYPEEVYFSLDGNGQLVINLNNA